MLDSSWCEKYKPKLSEIKDNQEVVEKLKIMIKTKLWTNFVLRGPVGCGKRTLINAFMNEVGCSDDNILRIYHSNLKIHDTRNLFSNFLEKRQTRSINGLSFKISEDFQYNFIMLCIIYSQ